MALAHKLKTEVRYLPEHWEEPQPLVVAEDLLEVAGLAQVEGALVRAVTEDGRAEGLWNVTSYKKAIAIIIFLMCLTHLERGHVAGDEVDVVAEEGGQRDAEHGRHEEQEQHVKPGGKNVNLNYLNGSERLIHPSDLY